MFGRKAEKKTVRPYSRLAEIYDYVMRHVDYVHWADYVESVFFRHDVLPRRVLDLACGTGSLAMELYRRGYQVAGADGCEEMLVQARRKTRAAGASIPFTHAGFLDLSGLPRFEAVLCLYDSVNYLMTLEEVGQAMRAFHRVVEPGGVLIFDVCTETNSLRYFRDMTDRDRGDGFSYVRHSSYEDGVQFNRFEIRFASSKEVVCEVHQQRIYPLSDVEAVLEDSSFRVIGVYDGFGFSAPTERSDRVHFVLRAQDSEGG